MDNDNFWSRLAAGHTNTSIPSAVDQHLRPQGFGEAFESVRHLTDRSREAAALPLPVSAGTRVSFAGSLGAVLSIDDPPAPGAEGEVVTVRSANGDITHHEGKVFVKWDDGKFRSVYAQHLRVASDLKSQFEKVKGLAEKKPDNKFLKGLLEQMADEGFAPTDKQMAVVKDIEKEVSQQAEMKKELKGLKAASADPTNQFGRVPPEVRMVRVASLGDLTNFLKVSSGSNTLIHRSSKELWSFQKDADGAFLVERLFDDNGQPLKG